MTDKKKAKIKLISPKATFRYPKLNKPDYGSDKYKKPDGEYSVQLIMSAEQAKPLIDKLQPLYEQAMEDGQVKFDNMPIAQRKKHGQLKQQPFYSEVYDKETDEPTGEVVFKFACPAVWKSKDGKITPRKPILVDAELTPMVNPPEIWGGSAGKVSFEPYSYFIAGQAMAGLKLSLVGVQVIDLVSGGDGGSLGFGKEDGFKFEEADRTDEDSSESSVTTTDVEEDF